MVQCPFSYDIYEDLGLLFLRSLILATAMADEHSYSSESSIDSPPMSPTMELRYSWDAVHYDEREREVFEPIRIESKAQNYEIAFTLFRTRNAKTGILERDRTVRTKLLQELEPADCQRYCFKDCMMYENTGLFKRYGMALDLLEHMWSEWFPHRDMDRDVADGNFFCNFAAFEPSMSLEGLYEFHFMLSTHVTAQQPRIRRSAAPNYATLDVAQDVPYHMRDSFSDAFVFLDNLDWRQQGVLLVFRDGPTAKKYGSNNLLAASPIAETGGLAFRFELKDAMHVMMFKDRSRVWPKKECSKFYQEKLSCLQLKTGIVSQVS